MYLDKAGDMKSEYESNRNRIAIIGMWCRVSDAKTPIEFWENLINGKESIKALPAVEINRPDERYINRKAELEDADHFDADFFDFTPAEAILTDPQHRQFLECSWHALANAGYDPSAGLGLVGVYASQSQNNYRAVCNPTQNISPITDFQADIYNSMGHLAAGVSYKLKFSGPSLTVQTACSSSLVAVHMACQGLLSGDCDMAVAGGVSICWPQHEGYVYLEGGIMSKDGHCRPFDAAASGTVRGEGVGVVILKRLDDAIADLDNIMAVILGSAVNNDGHRRAGYTAPGPDGQVDVIRRAIARADISPDTIGYVETHGTATLLGDAIEIAALREAFEGDTDQAPLCRIGALKANIGHLDAASGILSLIKATFAVSTGQLPPLLHFNSPNKNIDLEGSRFKFSSELEQWNDETAPRRAGISSFGLGGTNAHVVLEQFSRSSSGASHRSKQLVVLSAKSNKTLNGLCADLKRTALESPETSLADIAFTLAKGRSALNIRRAIVTGTIEDLCEELALPVSDSPAISTSAKPIFLLPDISTDFLLHVKDLRSVEPLFRKWMDICLDKSQTALGIDLDRVIEVPAEIESLDSKAKTALHFCSQFALAKTLISWGIKPRLIVGEGAGEYAAACLSGTLSIEQTLELITINHLSVSQQQLEEFLAAISTHQPTIDWISCAHGNPVTENRINEREFWLAFFNKPKHSRAALRHAMLPGTVGYELGSHSTLADKAQAICPKDSAVVAGFEAGEPASTTILKWLGLAWQHGCPIDWDSFYSYESRARRALPSPELESERYAPSERSYLARENGHSEHFDLKTPVDNLEQSIIDTMRQVLGVQEITATDDFFEIGGSSLTAIQVISILSETIANDVSLEMFFENSSARSLTAAINEAAANDMPGEKQSESEQSSSVCRIDSHIPAQTARGGTANETGPALSLCFFSADSSSSSKQGSYDFVLEASKFADSNGLKAVWLPERHFHRFGGLFPNPAVLAAAIAMVSRRIAIRAGSVVLPLHLPARTVEDWAVVDNLSGGRVGVSFAPGFHPVDFMLRPEIYPDRRKNFWKDLNLVREMWQGTAFKGLDGLNRESSVLVLPRPVQAQLPTWVTASEKEETFIEAGKIGANILTALLALNRKTLADRINLYRETLAKHHPGRTGTVTLMMHTFVHEYPAVVQKEGHSALRNYLKTHLDFSSKRNDYKQVTELSSADLESLLNHAVQRYLDGNSLIGTPDECWNHIVELINIGVDEIACLIDFGVDQNLSLESLKYLAELQQRLEESQISVGR
jgi:natural product biosynthesis luciferase-like monooxygenase protein